MAGRIGTVAACFVLTACGHPCNQMSEPEMRPSAESPATSPLPLQEERERQTAFQGEGCHPVEFDHGEEVVRSRTIRGIEFHVDLANATPIRQGEPMALALAFTSHRAGFQIDIGASRANGRSELERYELSPATRGADPLAGYFDQRVLSLSRSEVQPLATEAPLVLQRDLDEHLRIRAPGTYRLRVESRRISRDGATVACVSPEIQLTVLPADVDASKQRLREAVAVFASNRPSEGELRRAVRTLRYLGTEDAAGVIIELLVGARLSLMGRGVAISRELAFGLVGSPHRAYVVDRMQRALSREDAVVRPHFVSVLVELAAQLEVPGYLPPLQSWEQDRWARTEQAYHARRLAIEDRYARTLLESLRGKTEDARAAAVATLQEIAAGRQRSPDWLREVQRELGPRLVEMDEEAQRNLLNDRWLEVQDLSLVDPLLTLADAAETTPVVRALALARLLELDPERAEPRIEAEMQRGHLRLSAPGRDALALPFGPRPTLDESLAAGLEHFERDDWGLRAHLLARHGTAAILGRVRHMVSTQPPSRLPQPAGAIWAYRLRVDREQTVRALSARTDTLSTSDAWSRMGEELSETARFGWDPFLEEFFLRLLDRPESASVAMAARILGAHAGPGAEAALWRRLQTHREQSAASVPNGEEEGVAVEHALALALVQGRGWHLEQDALQRLRRLCVLEESRRLIDERADRNGLTLSIFLEESGLVAAHLGRYLYGSRAMPVAPLRPGIRRRFLIGEDVAAEPPAGTRLVRARALDDLWIKLLQFPRGTPIVLSVFDEGAEAEALHQTLRARMTERGLSVVNPD